MNPISSRPPLVCFDLGRVLVRICDGWKHAGMLAGVPMPAGDVPPGSSAELELLVHASEIGAISLDEFCAGAAPRLGLEARHVRAISDAYLLGLYPGAIELLEELTARGWPTACLSNTNSNHWRIMLEPGPCAGALDRLTHRFASHLARLRKPDPAIYSHVEQQSGFAPSEIIFFDDLPENVMAASDRGWHAHRIDVGPDPIQQIRGHLQAHPSWPR